jgi:hypothetical protein
MLAAYHWRDDTPEVEVEVKLVFPLLKYLGYAEDEIALRMPVHLVEGSKETTLQADWAVQNQARPYAFYLEAPVYIITNGKQIKIFHRDVLQDQCKVSCNTSRLGEHWKVVEKAAGKESVTFLKARLSNS